MGYETYYGSGPWWERPQNTPGPSYHNQYHGSTYGGPAQAHGYQPPQVQNTTPTTSHGVPGVPDSNAGTPPSITMPGFPQMPEATPPPMNPEILNIFSGLKDIMGQAYKPEKQQWQAPQGLGQIKYKPFGI